MYLWILGPPCLKMSTDGNAFLIAKYLEKDANMESARQISEHGRLTNEQYSWSAHSTVCVIRAMIPSDMDSCTDDKIVEKLYNEDDALSDFL
jgi:hypothetical protein